MNRLRILFSIGLISTSASLLAWTFAPSAVERRSDAQTSKLGDNNNIRFASSVLTSSSVSQPIPVSFRQGITAGKGQTAESTATSIKTISGSSAVASGALNTQSDTQPIANKNPKILAMIKSGRSFDGDIRNLRKAKHTKVKGERPEREAPDQGIAMPGEIAPIGKGFAISHFLGPAGLEETEPLVRIRQIDIDLCHVGVLQQAGI